jgi:CheY-like chemotaxis protein
MVMPALLGALPTHRADRVDCGAASVEDAVTMPPEAHWSIDQVAQLACAVWAAQSAAGSPRNLLYAQDIRINARPVTEGMRGLRAARSCIAESEAVALVVEGGTPDMLVRHAHVPGRSGHDRQAELRARPKVAATHAFLCSANALPSDVECARAAGSTDYCSKPIDPAQVLADLRTIPIAGAGR